MSLLNTDTHTNGCSVISSAIVVQLGELELACEPDYVSHGVEYT